jgi:hypothetical protein
MHIPHLFEEDGDTSRNDTQRVTLECVKKLLCGKGI